MTMLTIEMARQMSNEDLHCMVWDWYKDVNGFRPRHLRVEDREEMLSFIEYELRPEVQERRSQEWAEEEKRLAEMEARYEEEMREFAAKEKEQLELEFAYDDRYDHLAK